eukprot:14857605-Alexandrium_andersonii.AAC.1
MSTSKDGKPYLLAGDALRGQEGLEVKHVHALLNDNPQRREEDRVLGGDVPRAQEARLLGGSPGGPGDIRGRPVGKEGV